MRMFGTRLGLERQKIVNRTQCLKGVKSLNEFVTSYSASNVIDNILNCHFEWTIIFSKTKNTYRKFLIKVIILKIKIEK